ncbi:MAG: acetate--CoA ligase family protein [Deltaproteobacteria bacterium]|nr:acetate--CoA ligase family protein [Deltaproteobacteria bacterium]
MNIVELALSEGRKTLSEYESKLVLSHYGIPVVNEALARNESELKSALDVIGFPVAVKACAPNITHKTDLDLIRLDLKTEEDALSAFHQIMGQMPEVEGSAALVQKMAKGKREFLAGMTRDPQFGPCVMFGLGGIFTEALDDVSFRVAPLLTVDAHEMVNEIRSRKLLGSFRGMPPVNLNSLEQILVNLGRLGMENERIQEIDINPLIIQDGLPLAVDALIVLN